MERKYTPEDCGCELTIQEVDGHLDTQAFRFCTVHAAAPALLSALEFERQIQLADDAEAYPQFMEMRDAAILAAKGE